MDRIFICRVVPDESLYSSIVSQAANIFCDSLIESITFNRVISVPPSNVSHKIAKNNSKQYIDFLQVRKFNHKGVGKVINLILENILLCLTVLKTKGNIWFYNITPSILPAFIFIFLFRRKHIYILVADYYTQRLFSKLIKWLITHSKGVVSLSTGFQGTQFENVKILPGILPPSMVSKFSQKTDLINFSFLFSGDLTEMNGISLVLEAFAVCPQLKLFITGRAGPAVLKTINKYTSEYTNITYLGFLPFEDYISLLKNCTFGLSLRNPAFEDNQYNFPSKIIEYLYYDKIVISTYFYPQLNASFYYYVPYTKEYLIKFLTDIYAIPVEELIKKRGNVNQRDLAIAFGADTWKNAIQEIENYAG